MVVISGNAIQRAVNDEVNVTPEIAARRENLLTYYGAPEASLPHITSWGRHDERLVRRGCAFTAGDPATAVGIAGSLQPVTQCSELFDAQALPLPDDRTVSVYIAVKALRLPGLVR